MPPLVPPLSFQMRSAILPSSVRNMTVHSRIGLGTLYRTGNASTSDSAMIVSVLEGTSAIFAMSAGMFGSAESV